MGFFDRLRGKGPRRKPRYIDDKPIHDWTLEPELRMIRDEYARRLEAKEAIEAQVPEADKQAALQAEADIKEKARQAAELRQRTEPHKPSAHRVETLKMILRYLVATGRTLSDEYKKEAKALGIDIPEAPK